MQQLIYLDWEKFREGNKELRGRRVGEATYRTFLRSLLHICNPGYHKTSIEAGSSWVSIWRQLLTPLVVLS